MPPLNPHLHNPHLDGSPFRLDAPGEFAVLLLPGHGAEPKELNRVRWQDWTAAAISAYAGLCDRYPRVFVGGESAGGLLALYLAAEYPEIAGILAFAPALRLPLTRAQTLQLGLMAPFVASIDKGDLASDKTWQGYKVNPLKGVTQLLHLQTEVARRLPQVSQPLLVVQGRLDKTIDPQSAQAVYETAGSAHKEIHWMEKSGHYVLLGPEKHLVNRLAMDFLYKVKGLSTR